MPAPEGLEPQTVRNGSEFPVPNGSELKGGRPAVRSDLELLELATGLNQRLGRPPRADELITESGGCQRKRALAAIRAMKLQLAERAVQSQLVFPSFIEQGIRALVAQWLEHAAQQLASQHLDEKDHLEQRQAAQLSLIQEQQEKIALLSQQVADRERIAAELSSRLRRMEEALSHLREESVRVQALADERLRLLDRLRPPAVATSA